MGICGSKDESVSQNTNGAGKRSTQRMKKTSAINNSSETCIDSQNEKRSKDTHNPNKDQSMISSKTNVSNPSKLQLGSGTSKRGSKALKVLLLGSGDSGKSTILQQLKILHQNGFSQEELMEYKPFIFDNIVESARSLARARLSLKVPLEPESQLTEEDLQSISDFNVPGSKMSGLPLDFGSNLSRIWRLPSTQALMNSERRSEFYMMDNAPYFLDCLYRFCQPDFKPTVSDVLRARKKTSGIFDTIVELDNSLRLHIYDVGGQRSDRKKWIHCFDNVTAIIFCVSLSEYDQTLQEDKTQNRLEESFVLFDSVVNSRWFARTSVILFLNKVDVFAEKLRRVPLENYYSDFAGGADVNRGAKYILWRFLQFNRSNLSIYPHVTQATDTSNIKMVFAAIKETILENSLKASGVL